MKETIGSGLFMINRILKKNLKKVIQTWLLNQLMYFFRNKNQIKKIAPRVIQPAFE